MGQLHAQQGGLHGGGLSLAGRLAGCRAPQARGQHGKKAQQDRQQGAQRHQQAGGGNAQPVHLAGNGEYHHHRDRDGQAQLDVLRAPLVGGHRARASIQYVEYGRYGQQEQ